jgi:adenylate kinase
VDPKSIVLRRLRDQDEDSSGHVEFQMHRKMVSLDPQHTTIHSPYALLLISSRIQGMVLDGRPHHAVEHLHHVRMCQLFQQRSLLV